MSDPFSAAAERHLRGSLATKEALLRDHLASIVGLGKAAAKALAGGGKLLIFGNGGSAADAQHMAAELVVRLSSDFERAAIPALALTTDSSLLTACSNDYGYEHVFSRQIEAFGKAGDLALGISTSGNSGNVVRAFNIARERGLTIGLLSGKSGGKLKDMADERVLVPSDVTAHIQECHIAVIHILCDIIERANFAKEPA